MRPIFCYHGPVEGHQARGIGKIREQRGKIAVTHKNLRVSFDLFQVQRRQQIVCAVSSSRTNNRPDILARKHFFKFARTALHRSRKVKVLIENGVEIKRTIAGAPQTFASRLQIIALHVAGRSHNTDRISRPKGRRLDPGID